MRSMSFAHVPVFLPPYLLAAVVVLQVRAWVCVLLIVMMRLLNLAVPVLYKKVGWQEGSTVYVQ